ncbi:UNVERIFIED_CONTAM: hypothetical protein RMT77_015429 [Armadillidium vulgare]|nr:hypothetical protein Avbf_02745 [Armadillidium vulgare]
MYTKCDIVYLIFAFIGVLSGLSGFITFMFVYGNVQAGIWAFFTGFYAMATAFLFGLKMVEILDEWYGPDQMFRISLLGFAGSFASFVASVCYVSIIISFEENFPTKSTYRKSHIIMLVWSLLCLKWSLTSGFVARNQSKRLRSGYQAL